MEDKPDQPPTKRLKLCKVRSVFQAGIIVNIYQPPSSPYCPIDCTVQHVADIYERLWMLYSRNIRNSLYRLPAHQQELSVVSRQFANDLHQEVSTHVYISETTCAIQSKLGLMEVKIWCPRHCRREIIYHTDVTSPKAKTLNAWLHRPAE